MKNKSRNIITSILGLLMVFGVVATSLRSAAKNATLSVSETPDATKELIEDPVPSVIPTLEGESNTPSVAPVITPKPSPKPTTTPTPSPTPTPVNISGYTDGTYSARATYRTPESIESIQVTVVLKNGIVTSSDIAQSGNARESRRYQDRFASGYQQYVVGKSIADLKLGRVSGSSLTPRGFNDALSQIRSEARA